MRGKELRIESATLQRINRHDLPSIWIDSVHLLSREDGQVILRFYTALPEAMIEAARIHMSREQAQKFVAAMARNLEFYPSPPGSVTQAGGGENS